MPKLLRVSRVLRNAMATLAEQALLVSVQHVAESKPRWPGAELKQAWNRITMTNRRVACRISSDRIKQWYERLLIYAARICRQPIAHYSAKDTDEPWGDEDGDWWDIESSNDSSSSSNYNLWHS